MIYFDNAATSYPKPPSVIRSVEDCLRNYCGNPGRGAHFLSLHSAEKIYEARERIAQLFGSNSPENVFFTYNNTYALNMVIKGLLRAGDHVLISDMEHNSVYRPIASMADSGLIDYDVFDTFCISPVRTTESICKSIKKLIRPNTKMLIAAHASNICSASLPLKEIGQICGAKGILFVVDAAQSAGHLPLHMEKMNIDVICAPGHKGLYGIQGCGFAILREGVLPSPIIEGGSGVNSLISKMPELSPERFEAGTPSVPSIVALSEGIEFVKSRGIDEIHKHESKLYLRLTDMISSFPKVTHYAPEHIGSTLLFNISGIHCERVADMLSKSDICVRSGYHCSPLGHTAIGTINAGAVRVSFIPFNTERQLDKFYSAIKYIIEC